MDYEKKYRDLVEAVKELQEANPSDEGIQKWVEDNVPELRESEDEKIRKALISAVKVNIFRYLSIDKKDMLSWLEKQGGQKPAGWSDKDERNLTGIQLIIESWDKEHNSPDGIPSLVPEYCRWLESLKGRVVSPYKEGLSNDTKQCDVEEIKNYHIVEDLIRTHMEPVSAAKLCDWLKEKKHLYNIQNVPVDENKLKEDRRQAE